MLWKHARADDFSVISPSYKYRVRVPNNRELLQLYSCASFFKLLLQFFCFAL
mgnify:CR=1 FL=1|jgi:hypothetical protein